MSDYDLKKEVTDKYSLRGRVFHKIRQDILEGKYHEGEELRETTISQELGVSRTPVREALRQLELEGLVNIIPNKGAYVTGITAKDVNDIYVIRSLLEGQCAKWATQYISPEQLEELESIIDMSEYYISKENYQLLYELDNNFHSTLYKASKSKILEHTLSDFHLFVQQVRKFTMSFESRAKQAVEEHRGILMAIKEKDEAKAERLATEHILSTITNLGHFSIDNILHEDK